MTPEQDAILAKIRVIDTRFFARWPKENFLIRRPFPGEIDAMASMPGSAKQFGVYNSNAIYMIMLARAMVNGEPGHITMAEITIEAVPPEGVRGKLAEFMFRSAMARQGIDMTKTEKLSGPEGP